MVWCHQARSHYMNQCWPWSMAPYSVTWPQKMKLSLIQINDFVCCQDDVIKWKHFPRYWSFVRGIRRSPVNSPHKGQWRGALVFSLICTWTNDWAKNRDAGDLGLHHAQYDVTVMFCTVALLMYLGFCWRELLGVRWSPERNPSIYPARHMPQNCSGPTTPSCVSSNISWYMNYTPEEHIEVYTKLLTLCKMHLICESIFLKQILAILLESVYPKSLNWQWVSICSTDGHRMGTRHYLN